MKHVAPAQVPHRFTDQEPIEVSDDQFQATEALPGSREKIVVLEQRIRQGLPLWHPADRRLQPQRIEDEESLA